MPFGTPGGDVQVQTMLQVFLNIVAFGMDPQQAVEAPRFAGYGFPSSFWPLDRIPGRLNLEPEIGAETGAALEQRGHRIEWWSGPMNAAGTVCAIIGDLRSGLISGGADIRRNAYAVGW
jgi:gamma-glutamyltranspeptidase/glutathione hydrolase